MFSYIFMKIFEIIPRFYDKGVNVFSGGKLEEVRGKILEKIFPGSTVLEIGCGTGELAKRMAEKGVHVDAFDINPKMVELARKKASETRAGSLNVMEMGVERMDLLEERRYDAVVAVLVFSELSSNEQRFALEQAFRVLKPGGKIIIADEVKPERAFSRIFYHLVRLPLLMLTYLLTGKSTCPLENLEGMLESTGFCVKYKSLFHGGSFILIEGTRKE